MTKILIVLLIAFAFEAFGVITLKQGINVIGAAYTARKSEGIATLKNVLKLVGQWFTNKSVLLSKVF